MKTIIIMEAWEQLSLHQDSFGENFVLPVWLSLLACLATVLGGFIVWRVGTMPAEILAGCAGMLIAVVAFDLLPESFRDIGWFAIPSIIAGERFLHFWGVWSERAQDTSFGWAGAGSLVLHSLFDGVAIGVGASASLVLNLSFGAVVVLHDFCDGVNTMTLMRRNDQPTLLCWLFLGANALAPISGVMLSNSFSIPTAYLGWILAFLAGFLIHVCIHELLPMAYKSATSPERVAGAAFLGAALIATLTQLMP